MGRCAHWCFSRALTDENESLPLGAGFSKAPPLTEKGYVSSKTHGVLRVPFFGGGSVSEEGSPSLSRQLEHVETEVTNSDELKLV